MENQIKISGRVIGPKHKPFVIAEIGINHDGDYEKAKRMVYDAHKVNAECVKFQYHVIEDEMIKNDVIPANANASIWEIVSKCRLSDEEHKKLKKYTEELGMIYLCTPFSRAAANKLAEMDVPAFKIGSGECNNYPLIKHIASFKKPIILSTGMNNIPSIKKATKILDDVGIEYAILHCTSLYPTPYDKVRLGALKILKKEFPNAVIGLSDHSIGNYTSFGAVALGGTIIEKHFTSDKTWPGPDIEISISPAELKDLIIGCNAIHYALGGSKEILNEERPTIDFAYASVVTIENIKKNEEFTVDNIWVKRPGTGEILAENYEEILGKKAKEDIKKCTQLKWDQIE